MIKASELRIGNYIIIDGTPAVIKTLNIPDNELLWINYVQGFKNPLQTVDEDGPWPPDRYNPIPLTREWLNKFGFRQFANGAYHKEEMLTWRVWYDDYEKAAGYCTDVYPELGHAVHLPIRIEYVHQLQNIYFMMTEKELTINHAHLQSTS